MEPSEFAVGSPTSPLSPTPESPSASLCKQDRQNSLAAIEASLSSAAVRSSGLIMVYSESNRGFDVGDCYGHIPEQAMDGNLFTCICRDASSTGFTPSLVTPLPGVLERVHHTRGESVRTFDAVPTSTLLHDADFVWNSTTGLYCYSAIVGAGSVMHRVGRILAPSLVPLSTERLSLAQVPGAASGSLFCGTQSGRSYAYPHVTSPLPSNVISGTRLITSCGSSLANSLAQPTGCALPVLVILAPCTHECTRAIEVALSLVKKRLGAAPEVVTQILATTEDDHSPEQSIRTAVNRFYRVWTVHCGGGRPDHPEALFEFLDGSAWHHTSSATIVFGARVGVCMLTHKPGTPFPATPDFMEALPSLLQRATYLRHALPRDGVTTSVPAFRRSIFLRNPLPRLSLFHVVESRSRKPTLLVSPSLEIIYGTIRSINGSSDFPRLADELSGARVRLDSLLSAMGESLPGQTDLGTSLPHISALRLAIAMASSPSRLVEGGRRYDVPSLLRASTPRGTLPVMFSGGLVNPGGLCALVTGSPLRFAPLAHRMGAGSAGSEGAVSTTVPDSHRRCVPAGGDAQPPGSFQIDAKSPTYGDQPPQAWSAELLQIIAQLADSIRSGTPLATNVIRGTQLDRPTLLLRARLASLVGNEQKAGRKRGLTSPEEVSLVTRLRNYRQTTGSEVDEIVNLLRQI